MSKHINTQQVRISVIVMWLLIIVHDIMISVETGSKQLTQMILKMTQII